MFPTHVSTKSGSRLRFVLKGSSSGRMTAASQRIRLIVKHMNFPLGEHMTQGKASEAILSLRPVTFHYKSDAKQTPQFGLVAEEVAKVNPALVLPDKEGKPFTVRYDQVNAMLLNEFLKEHRTVQEQQKEIDALRAELKEERAIIQKVSDKLELERPATQTVLNNR
jgi:hypothetical protein